MATRGAKRKTEVQKTEDEGVQKETKGTEKVLRWKTAKSEPDALANQVSSPLKECKQENCTKFVEGGNPYCTTHGGGRKCQHEGCRKHAEVAVGQQLASKDSYCKAHREERRKLEGKTLSKSKLKIAQITKSTVDRKCQHANCSKLAAHGGTLFCMAHGGGLRCKREGCDNPAICHGTPFCKSHEVLHTCMAEGCTNIPEGYAINCAYHGGMGGNGI
mmetsp:Transcript_26698/g.44776  ORF Transcript_26698/g.44776 Transcript_26698/m.44776 type:complete len:217 (+) Transcript_26698:318-968(+)|eukprot:CAMPEP_0198210580 /NCGR_PEP_ID=MMETSP1445-20131203/20807_1 /TAXON_ID=36898 /ORGANISM="Pyramimonas sp., Strain CCMP2087" /LENGTH=216 /DNA_ID=CAMNT_0043884675 /DNA_START=311 /DNA_END=961 /DNA_ORIENTATION=+